MKLKEKQIEFIKGVVETALLVNIDSVVIETGRVRGMDENRTVVLFQKNEDEFDFEFGSLGITRINDFLSRLRIAQMQENFTVEAVIDDEKDFIRSIIMKAKGTKIDYRCADPTHISAPRIINDIMESTIHLDVNAFNILKSGVAAMGNVELVTIKSVNGNVTFELEDVNGDNLNYMFDEGIDHNFSHKYPVKTLLALFKQDPEGAFEIGQKGMLRVSYKKLGVYVLPRIS